MVDHVLGGDQVNCNSWSHATAGVEYHRLGVVGSELCIGELEGICDHNVHRADWTGLRRIQKRNRRGQYRGTGPELCDGLLDDYLVLLRTIIGMEVGLEKAAGYAPCRLK
jgi:hypothetical protein